MNTLLIGSVALLHGAFFLWILKGKMPKSKGGAHVLKGKGPMVINSRVWDKEYWDTIENTKKTYGSK